MVVALTLENDLSQAQASEIIDLSNLLEKYFESKSYGNDVLEILIGIMALDTSTLEHLFKIRKPSYTDFQIIKDGIGNPVEISKNLEWDVKPEYELLKDAEGLELQSIVAKSILESITDLKLPKKIKDFDLLAFKNDIGTFFNENKLL